MATAAVRQPKRTIMLTYDPNNDYAQSVIQMLGLSKAFKIEESPYDPMFVKKIQHAKSSKGVEIETADLWK